MLDNALSDDFGSKVWIVCDFLVWILRHGHAPYSSPLHTHSTTIVAVAFLENAYHVSYAKKLVYV